MRATPGSSDQAGLRLARNSYKALPEVTGRSGSVQECLDHLDRHLVDYLARQHLGGLADRNSSADRVVDKMPDNTFYLGLMAVLFPRAESFSLPKGICATPGALVLDYQLRARQLGLRSAPHCLAIR